MTLPQSLAVALNLLSLVNGALLPRQAATPTVVLPQGTLVGTTTVLPSATASVNKYLGVAFALPFPKRFEQPQPVASSKATFQAKQWSNKYLPVPGDTSAESEDCLYLNVYAPASASRTDLKPVMFWIYGGSLESGNAGQALYDGSSLATYQDVIVVSANYRLTAFGFSNSPALNLTSRNVGFYDQRLALSWVQQNIASFGGDPTKVTIFGESSGASSVDRLLTAPPAVLPYRAAILQSGQASVSYNSPPDGLQSWKRLVQGLNCVRSSDALELQCVQAVNATQVKSVIANSGSRLAFPPVNDNVTQKQTPLLAARRAGQAAKVPMLIGSNGYEVSIFLSPIFKNPSAINSQDALNRAINATFGPYIAGVVAPTVRDQFAAGSRTLFFALSAVLTDLVYKCSASLVAQASHDASIPTWRYLFNATYPNTQQFVNIPSLGINDIGAFHISELPIVFGSYDIFGAPTSNEIAMSRYMQQAWADFARNPSSTTGPGWVRYNTTVNDLGCLGCASSPTSVSLINSKNIDASCSAYNSRYTATVPGF